MEQRQESFDKLVKQLDKFSKGWVFTINNWKEEEWDKLLALREKSTLRYLIVGKEVGAEGTPHLQGAMIWRDQKKGWTLFNQLGKRIRLRIMRGTAEQNRKYCSKDGEHVEFGENPNDIDSETMNITTIGQARQWCKKNPGATDLDIMERCDTPQTIKFCKEYLMRLNEKKRTSEPEVYWFWGPSGTGKTRTAVEMCGDEPYFFIGDQGDWWDGYRNEKFVIVDDARPQTIPFGKLLRWTDRYHVQCNKRYGGHHLGDMTVIITSPKRPELMYLGYDVGSMKQLIRRCTEIREFVVDEHVNP